MRRSGVDRSLVPILLDRRVGSAELFGPLQQRRVPVELTTLPFGDAGFACADADGEAVVAGIERKTIRDLVQSIHTGRLSGHQLPGLATLYTHRWLVIEGQYREGERGLLEVPSGRKQWEALSMSAVGLQRYLLTLELLGGCGIRHTRDLDDTCVFLEAIWGWLTKDRHRAHLSLHRPPDVALFTPPSLAFRVAAELPGIGWERAGAVSRRFTTVRQMVDAEADEWLTITGIGKTIAARAVAALQRGQT